MLTNANNHEIRESGVGKEQGDKGDEEDKEDKEDKGNKGEIIQNSPRSSLLTPRS
ncbi:hypothetical protein [Chroococcidiopsis sp.]|uniref:hypothetical protein n=1 Tax=Chroococcidiopsis sp. TaxID=3088168 RepID=UPI003F327EEB